MNTNIETLATALDASVIYDSAGDIALQARVYDDDGVQQVRYRPDPCDFLPLSEWQSMAAEEAARQVC